MKKTKWPLMILVILFSIGAAFATRPKPQSTLFYWNGTSYVLAGAMGVNYYCGISTQTCTYTYSNGVYSPYDQGTYIELAAQNNAPPATSKAR
jgi:Family of unknown function (DUF6520)